MRYISDCIAVVVIFWVGIALFILGGVLHLLAELKKTDKPQGF